MIFWCDSLLTSLLGGRIHIRLDVLLAIIVPDMLTIVDEYANIFFSQATTSQKPLSCDASLNETCRLKPIEERWRQNSSRRDRGFYSQAPDEPILTDLVSSLLATRCNVNENLNLPSVKPDWFNVAIRLPLSVQNHSDNPRFILPPDNDCPLLSSVTTFINDWSLSSTHNSQRKTSVHINFSLPIDQMAKLRDRSNFILEHILMPLLPCQMVVNTILSCKYCQSVKKKTLSITSIPVNIVRSGLHLEHEIHSFFTPTLSDMPCITCGKICVRHIEVVQWPPIIIINVNDIHRNIKFRKPPGVISLAQFSNWLAISSPSASVYELVCFNSIIRSGAHEAMVQVTKTKKSWSTNVNKRLIGEGEQLLRLYAHSRKST